MVKFKHELTMQNEVDEVFSFIANPENSPIWDLQTLESVRLIESPLMVGTTGQIVSTFLGRGYEPHFTFEEYDPPHLVSHRITAGSMEMETTNGLKELENCTQITMDCKVKFKGLNKLMEPFIARRMKKQVSENLEVLQLFFRLKSLS
jgi:hypothetical protein